jgi:hypothetical protein
MPEPEAGSSGAKQIAPEPWRANIDPDRRKRRRRITNQRQALHQVTVGTVLAAAGLNAVLFVQTALDQSNPGDVQSAIVSAVQGLFPGAGLRPPASPPSQSPNTKPHAVTGSS